MITAQQTAQRSAQRTAQPTDQGYRAGDGRYDVQPYRRTGRSGLDLPAVSLGLWQGFGGQVSLEHARAVLRRAVDLGVTHLDLANNYGPPYGRAEVTFGQVMATDLAPYRDELVIATKAGYDTWPGPHGQGGGSREHLLASLDQSLARTGLDHVDVFYSHRDDPSTPLEETMGALDTAVRSGRAVYAGISSCSTERTRQAAAVLASLGTPLLIHQPSYSILDRWVETTGLLELLGELGVGCIAFSPLAQGLLTDRYLDGVPAGSRASRNGSLTSDRLTPQTLGRVRALEAVARERGQSLAQMALAWALRDERVTSVLVGASSVEQLEADVAATQQLGFTGEELAAIDRAASAELAVDGAGA